MLRPLSVLCMLDSIGTHPFDASNDADDAEVTRRVLAGAEASGAFCGSTWSRVPHAARSLLRRLLSASPEARPRATEILAHAWLQDPLNHSDEDGEEFCEKAAQSAVDALREFHSGRRRFKAMLLAVMIGYADEGIKRDRGTGTAQLGSRRAAMDVFDVSAVLDLQSLF